MNTRVLILGVGDSNHSSRTNLIRPHYLLAFDRGAERPCGWRRRRRCSFCRTMSARDDHEDSLVHHSAVGAVILIVANEDASNYTWCTMLHCALFFTSAVLVTKTSLSNLIIRRREYDGENSFSRISGEFADQRVRIRALGVRGIPVTCFCEARGGQETRHAASDR